MARCFFDKSALVKHYHPEAGTAEVDRLIGETRVGVVILRLTHVETVSVFAIKVRTGEFDAADFARLRGRISADAAQAVSGRPSPHARHARVPDLIRSHGLARQIRMLDALQLAVALHFHEAGPLDHFVCSDGRLCDVRDSRSSGRREPPPASLHRPVRILFPAPFRACGRPPRRIDDV